MTNPKIEITCKDDEARVEFESLAGMPLEKMVEGLANQLGKRGIQHIRAVFGRLENHQLDDPQPIPQAFGIDLVCTAETEDHAARFEPRFEFYFADKSAQMHVTETGVRSATHFSRALGNNAFWQIQSNFIDVAKKARIEKFDLKLSNDIMGCFEYDETSLSIALKAGLKVTVKPNSVNKDAGCEIPEMVRDNFEAISDLMTGAEKDIFQRATADPAHIDFPAIASLSRRIYCTHYEEGFFRGLEYRQVTNEDKAQRPLRIIALGDVLLDGLIGEATIDLTKNIPLPQKIRRIFERMSGDAGLAEGSRH